MWERLRKLYYRMMWKSRKNYLTALLSETFIIAVILFSLMIGSGLLYVSQNETAKMTPLIFEMEKMFLIPYIFLMFLQILILLDYIRKRAQDYAMLTVLGMKKKHRYLFMAGEYISLIIGSILLGLSLGFLGGIAVRPVLEYIFQDVVKEVYYGTSPFKITLIVCGIMFGLGFMICDQIISCLGLEYVVSSGGSKIIKTYKNSAKIAFTLSSLFLLCFILMLTYWGEISDIPISVTAVTAIGLTVYFGGESYLSALQRIKKKYYRRILYLDGWYNRFRQHMNKSFIIAVFLLIIMFSFNLMLINNLPVIQPENYPYDLVWHGNQGDEVFLKELQKTYGIEYQTISCIRVATGDCGEHTGISASEYEKLTGEKIKLSDKELYVVYQRDRSETGESGIDYGDFRPDIYIGSAVQGIWVVTPTNILPGNLFTREYQIAGSDERIITGNFESRALPAWYTDVFEEILVFSDREYDEICGNTQGANLTVLMDIPKSYDKVVKSIRSYAKKFSQVNFFDSEGGNLIYERRECLIENRQNKIFNLCSAIMNAVILFVCILMILIEAVESESERQKWKFQYLSRMGMSEKKQKRNFYREINMTAKIGLLGGIPYGFLLMMAKALHKKMEVKWTLIYLAEGIGTALVLSGGLMLIMRGISRGKFLKLRGRNEK